MSPVQPSDDLSEQIREDEIADLLRRLRERESTIETSDPIAAHSSDPASSSRRRSAADFNHSSAVRSARLR